MTSIQMKLQRAKRTRLGRFLCALLGDQRGAVAMEYVVIALLVAAAVVGVVMVFGSRIANMFTQSTQALSVKESEMAGLASQVQSSRETDKSRVEEQQKQGDVIRGSDANKTGGEE
ncbi:MAG: Flp family type IVb pilin [Victivallales bacterium]|nr:Flp family type IVb pilin [Victivallales bacterium]